MKLGLFILAIITIVLLLSTGRTLGAGDTVKVVLIPKVYDETNDFWTDMVSGAESAAKEYQVDLTILAPDVENDVEQQKDYIERAIKMKPDIIALSPILYTGMTDTVQKVIDAGIPLVLIDSKLDEEIEVSYIGTDNIEAGKKAGKKVLEYMQDDTKIAVMSHVKAASTAIEREKGLRQGLGKEEDRIQTVLYSNSNYQSAYDQTVELLKERQDINFMVGLNLYSTVGVARAVKDLNLQDRVHVVGLDNDVEGIQYMETGIIDALVVQKPYHMGYFGIKTAAEAARKQKVDSVIYCDTEVVTIDNIYSKENEKLLFSF